MSEACHAFKTPCATLVTRGGGLQRIFGRATGANQLLVAFQNPARRVRGDLCLNLLLDALKDRDRAAVVDHRDGAIRCDAVNDDKRDDHQKRPTCHTKQKTKAAVGGPDD